MAGNRLSPEAYVRHLRADGERFACAVGSALAALVAACPGWTAADLGYHLGEVQFCCSRCGDGLCSDASRSPATETPSTAS